MQKLASALLRLKIKRPPVPYLALINIHIIILGIPVSRNLQQTVISSRSLQLPGRIDHCAPFSVKRDLVARRDISDQHHCINSQTIVPETLGPREIKFFVKRHINYSDISGYTTLAAGLIRIRTCPTEILAIIHLDDNGVLSIYKQLGHIEAERRSCSRMTADLFAVESNDCISVNLIKAEPGPVVFRFGCIEEFSIPHSTLIVPVFRILSVPYSRNHQFFCTVKIIFHQFCLVIIETFIRKIY